MLLHPGFSRFKIRWKKIDLRRGGRVAEGAPLLREYGLKAHRGFESLPLRHAVLSPTGVSVGDLDYSYNSDGYKHSGHLKAN